MIDYCVMINIEFMDWSFHGCDLHLLDGWVYAVEHICLKLCNNIFFICVVMCRR